ncbi:hypothetical protein BD309DRAFT_988005 [Dichomitus squalens]|uniref:Phosphatidate phosphatase APP1 catalytic domain-containing protein n=1 Tax=Dichomitus squalens TaxID=114155 RepID=A0A4Q9Q1Y1_9APHY|nr:hypothetical protein BD309DRAFT_988005 [Dichomitus squalens]TBU60584.1 hypothetical protein BD310DRAFT_947307 [Dichomitus squalens]
MAPSWRSLASAASRSLKGYIAQQRDLKQGYPLSRSSGAEATKKQSWSQWAGQKLRRAGQGEYDTSGDRLTLFPGWAARRYSERPQENSDGDRVDAPFDVDVFVSGYACKLTGIGFTTRAGRTFLRLAKSFAALPKLPNAGQSKSTEDLLGGTRLPPLPDEITEETEMQALDDQLHRLDVETRSIDSGRTADTLSMKSAQSNDSRTPSSSAASSSNSNAFVQGETLAPPPIIPGTSTELHRWHANLEARLHPFWSSVLPNRVVRISLYAADPSLYNSDDQQSSSSHSSVAPEREPIVTRNVITAVDGSFQLKLSVPWERMCVHPGALHVAFGGSELEQDLFVVAELLAPPSPGPATPTGQHQQFRELPSIFSPVTVAASIPVPLTYSSIRVISDIDDTVKLSGILSGARTVFHNVFVKDLRDSVIRGMGEWYTGMWKRGVRFHYVSNSPFELLPVVNEFLQLSDLPPGSVRLRSYGGRSLFNGLLSAPAMRKRAAVVDVLNHFPDARFFLVGDSGEQDLELYAEFARERPEQILAIFIRDARARDDDSVHPLDDPTGVEAFRWSMDAGLTTPGSAPTQTSGRFSQAMRRANSKLPLRSMSQSDAVPQPPPPAAPRKVARSYSGADVASRSSSNSSGSSTSPTDYFSSAARSHSPITEEPHESPPMEMNARSWPPSGFSKPPPGSQAERRESGFYSQAQLSTPLPDMGKMADLQMRLWKARLDVPPQIPLRVFREPEECVEVDEVLEKLQVRGR